MSLHSELGWNSTVCAFDDSLSPSEAAIWYTCLCALPPADAAYLTAGLEGWSHEVVVVGERCAEAPEGPGGAEVGAWPLTPGAGHTKAGWHWWAPCLGRGEQTAYD